MREVCICGRFNKGRKTPSGQVIKTRIIYDALCREIGGENISVIDLYGGFFAVPRILWQLWRAFCSCKKIIIMPAYRGVRVLTPVCGIYNKIHKKEIHYIVIGGWLSSFIEKHKSLYKGLLRFDRIYVETSTMEASLKKKGFENVVIMKNFKVLTELDVDDVAAAAESPFSVCTFSRVVAEKGIEDAIEAVITINEERKSVVYKLDIYGEISPEYKERFEMLRREFPPYIKYKGLVPYDRSVEILKNYFVLLFPTKLYYSEGVPGTIIDAYASGVPVIAAKWESFADVVDDGRTGIGYDADKPEELTLALRRIAENPQTINAMRDACLRKAKEFSPQAAMNILLKEMGVYKNRAG